MESFDKETLQYLMGGIAIILHYLQSQAKYIQFSQHELLQRSCQVPLITSLFDLCL